MSLLHPGFADPVHDSQAVFRAVLDALARPGHVHDVAALAEPPPPLDRATASVLLTLIDAETPLWMDGRARAAREWIAFHCGALSAEHSDASFAVALAMPLLSTLSPGSDEEPERSATLILQVQAIGEGSTLTLSGPGLATPNTLAVDGLPDDFVKQWAANRRKFPRGVDLILCAGDQLAALPRTVEVT